MKEIQVNNYALCTLVICVLLYIIWETSTLVSYAVIKKCEKIKECAKAQKRCLSNSHKEFQVIYNDSS